MCTVVFTLLVYKEDKYQTRFIDETTDVLTVEDQINSSLQLGTTCITSTQTNHITNDAAYPNRMTSCIF